MTYDYENTKNSKLSQSEIKAIKFAIQYGKILRDIHPDIAILRFQNMSYAKISKKENIQNLLNINVEESTAKEIVRYSLIGYKGNLDFVVHEPYEGLIGKDTNKDISKLTKKNVINSINEKVVLKKQETGKDYRLSDEERIKFGKLGGEKVKKERKGYCGISLENRINNGKKSVESRGFVTWTNEEDVLLGQLMLNNKYKNKSHYALQDIANVLNDKIHEGKNVRKSNTVGKHINDVYNKRQKLAPFIYTIVYLESLK
ncbi:MAG: hypothetical protein AB7V77_05595 [Candidatus Woesearchaeota archaeon]